MKNTDILYATKLYQLRRRANMDQKQVFELLGFNNQQAYSKLERGETHFTDEMIDQVCKLFSIPLADFTSSHESIYINNSPNSGNNAEHNSTINDNHTLLEELRYNREERKQLTELITRMVNKLVGDK